MHNAERIKRLQLKESIEAQFIGSIEQKIGRYLEMRHQGIIGGHYFAEASSECILLYRDGYFIGAVMMSHAINEGIIKFVAERNNIERREHAGLIKLFLEKNIISKECVVASIRIWESYRNDIHHMNPKVAEIPFADLAKRNLKDLAVIEKEIFGFDLKEGTIIPHQPKYWDLNKDGTTVAYLRLE